MNTYIIAYSNSNECWLESVKAKSYKEAQDKFIEKAINDWDVEVPLDWDDYVENLKINEVNVSEIKDIDEYA